MTDQLSTKTEDIRIGIIRLDTSDVIHFTRQLNHADALQHVPGGKFVATFKGGSPDLATSADVSEVRGGSSHIPARIKDYHPDLFRYGIHPTEVLYAGVGTGGLIISRVHTEDPDVVTGAWRGGAAASMADAREKAGSQ